MTNILVITASIYIFLTAVTGIDGFDLMINNNNHMKHHRTFQQQQQHRSDNNNDNFYFTDGRRIHMLRLGAKSSNNKQPQDSAEEDTDTAIPSNEFSRTLPTDRILKSRKSIAGASNNNNNFYPVSLEANEMECIALARRFDLSSITTLSATLQLRPSSLNTGGVSSSSIEVEGMCQSNVIQRCVRTNENFEVALEFPIFCIVRPVIPNTVGASQQDLSSTTGSYQNDNDNNSNSNFLQPQHRKQNGLASNKKSYRLPDRNLDEMDVMELQRMLQADMSYDDDTLMEDEAIYKLQDGQIDVGELVAQLFWFKLDPYPKKPGTDPIQRSITG